MDGDQASDQRFHTGGGQPSAVLTITEPDGRQGVLVIDLGDDKRIFEHNLDIALEGTGDPAGTAIVFTHAHTYAGGKVVRTDRPEADGLAEMLGRFPQTRIQGTNVKDSCRADRIHESWREAGLCEDDHIELLPGLVPLQWSHGPSKRVFLLTYIIEPPEHNIPFAQMETLVVVRDSRGYLLYSTCSHTRRMELGDDHPPMHAAYLLLDAMEDGLLPRLPVHTLVAGTCGMLQTFSLHGGRDERGNLVAQRFVDHLHGLKEDLGLERLYLSHCGLREEGNPVQMMFLEVFGDGLRLAYPGTSLEL